MGFLGSDKPKVSKMEFDRDVKHRLFSRGIPETVRDKMEIALDAHMNESGMHKGMDADEIDKMTKHFREKKNDYGISDHHIDILEEELKKKL